MDLQFTVGKDDSSGYGMRSTSPSRSLQTVRNFVADFTKAFVKMQGNGAGGLEVGPTHFWETATIDG